MQKTILQNSDPAVPYDPAIGPLGDVAYVFRRLGGISRLDVVCSMIGVACVAFWSCLRTGKRKAVRATIRPTVYLLSYIPAETKIAETA
ncbi:hypothetical protein KUV46_15480 [Thalassovita mediterranea]|nr:hypothetical protein KUV46_15480 [Thalassovita mediterranea]